ncbi:hypothetical protein GWK47_054950 [Chionoecetes opilio]|uniref:Uncharacterized protein n=1 Tax=Chionoecetes opilio TaxID=41210 RepID=A0A8J4XZY5_CHIOP|nr:hypothetical protein GWK47_054950 [Chionoecetes opilio]
MAQFLQGFMEEGMGGVETPAAGSGRGKHPRGPCRRHTRATPRVTHQALTSHQPLSSNSGQRPCSGAHHLLQDQGERPWACRRQRLRHGPPVSRTTAASAAGRRPQLHLMYASFVTQRCNSASTRAWASKCFRQLSTTEAIDVVRGVVIGTRCIVGAWAEFFSLAQASSDSVCAYISRCRAKANECGFRCPECQCSLEEYMLSKKIVMGLRDRSMKAGVLRCFPCFESFSEVVRVCEVIEAAEKASEQPSSYVASVEVGDAPPPPFMAPHPAEVAAAGPARRPGGQGKARQDGVRRRRRRCTAFGDSECTGGRQCRAFAATCRCCGQKGHLGAGVRPSSPRAAFVRPPTIRTSPLPPVQ